MTLQPTPKCKTRNSCVLAHSYVPLVLRVFLTLSLSSRFGPCASRTRSASEIPVEAEYIGMMRIPVRWFLVGFVYERLSYADGRTR